MRIRVGYDLAFDCPEVTPMVLMLTTHYTCAADLVVPDHMVIEPAVPVTTYRDGFGNWCTRLVAPAGRIRMSARALLGVSGEPDRQTTRGRGVEPVRPRANRSGTGPRHL